MWSPVARLRVREHADRGLRLSEGTVERDEGFDETR